jgi:hypothetical protein
VSRVEDENKTIAYYDGMREGVRLYAHWKDGVQYVGTTGKTLKKALEEITLEEQQKLEDIRYYGGGR